MKRLDDAQTTLIKGVGILLIIGHNFQYLVSALPGVNEFVFAQENFTAFIDGVRSSPLSLPRLLLAYFGHYAVQIFIFLSGYGLASSFAKRQPTWPAFMARRFTRLYPAFVLAMIAWALWKQFPQGVSTSVLLKLALISNLIPGEQLSLVGPWWFVAFIFQFYLVFPLLFRLTDRALGLVALLGFITAVGLNETVLPGGFLFATPLGHLPEFCLGIWWARAPRQVGWLPTVVATLVFAAGNVWAPAWYLSHASALVVTLGCWPLLRAPVERTQKVFAFLGALSLELFLVNGFLRDPFMRWAKGEGSEWAAWSMGALSLFTCLAVALLIKAALTVLERRLAK